jgi:hypothetical protein
LFFDGLFSTTETVPESFAELIGSGAYPGGSTVTSIFNSDDDDVDDREKETSRFTVSLCTCRYTVELCDGAASGLPAYDALTGSAPNVPVARAQVATPLTTGTAPHDGTTFPSCRKVTIPYCNGGGDTALLGVTVAFSVTVWPTATDIFEALSVVVVFW